MSDLRAYRVNLICSCQNDVAYGYGPNAEAARIVAEVEFRRAHGSAATYTQVVVEKVTPDGSHYETESVALRLDFTDGVGSELDALALEAGLGSWWADAFHYTGVGKRPYYFESSLSHVAMALTALLSRAARGVTTKNRMLRKAAADMCDKSKALRKALWGSTSGNVETPEVV